MLSMGGQSNIKRRLGSGGLRGKKTSNRGGNFKTPKRRRVFVGQPGTKKVSPQNIANKAKKDKKVDVQTTNLSENLDSQWVKVGSSSKKTIVPHLPYGVTLGVGTPFATLLSLGAAELVSDIVQGIIDYFKTPGNLEIVTKKVENYDSKSLGDVYLLQIKLDNKGEKYMYVSCYEGLCGVTWDSVFSDEFTVDRLAPNHIGNNINLVNIEMYLNRCHWIANIQRLLSVLLQL